MDDDTVAMPLEMTPAVPPSPNPCVRAFGPDPEGRTCKTCAHLYAKHFSKTYYKCGLRGSTNGPATDHRQRWPACARFKARE